MNNLKSVLLENDLTWADPDMRYMAKGATVCGLSIACKRYFNQDDRR